MKIRIAATIPDDFLTRRYWSLANAKVVTFTLILINYIRLGTQMRFHYLPSENKSSPILISIPHCGTEIPAHLGLQTSICPDTDWFLEHLYDFAPQLGIAIIHARFARYVVDLNRNPSSVPLYNDGRILTDAIPTTQFDGTALYDTPPTKEQKQERIK